MEAVIGTVLEDWRASKDAMQWRPQREICDTGRPLAILRHPPSVKVQPDWLDAMIAAYAARASGPAADNAAHLTPAEIAAGALRQRVVDLWAGGFGEC